MRYEILHTEYYDENGNAILWSLLFDGQEFVLDMDDLLTIANILKTFFEDMGVTEGVIFPLVNRQKVINGALK